MTHYEVLGIDRTASTSQVRAAFRRQARAHHPDTSRSGSAESLTPVNEAWRVLGDPALRRAYDRSLDAPDQPSSAPESGPEWSPAPVPTSPPESSFPWRFLAGLTAVGIGIVLLGVFTYEPSAPGPPDNVLEAGSCVVIEDNGDASEVNCTDDHDGVVESMIGAEDLCPFDLEAHRDRQGLGVVCVRFSL
ncbi:MAG: DnaJ domain-containing protein [Ilumatobacteraceae bacterium]